MELAGIEVGSVASQSKTLKLACLVFSACWKQSFGDANFSGGEMILIAHFFFAVGSPGMDL